MNMRVRARRICTCVQLKQVRNLYGRQLCVAAAHRRAPNSQYTIELRRPGPPLERARTGRSLSMSVVVVKQWSDVEGAMRRSAPAIVAYRAMRERRRDAGAWADDEAERAARSARVRSYLVVALR